MLKWNPIETAPKDGTVIDLHFLFAGRMVNCFFDVDIDRWVNHSHSWANTIEKDPTHWMPLPETPNK